MALLLVSGCAPLDAVEPPPALDEPYFRCRVQPVVSTYCATFACHGDGRRFFRLFARNRLRLGGTEATRNALLSEQERLANYESARGFVDGRAVDESLLLRKPLTAEAGGAFHRASEIFPDGNVWASADEPAYRVLVAWAGGATDGSACVEPGSDR